MIYQCNGSTFCRIGLLAFAGTILSATVIECQEVVGTVIDRTTGTPLAGAEVLLRGTESGGLLTTSSDAQGRFSFENLGFSQFRVEVFHPGYVSASTEVTLQVTGAVPTLDVLLRPDPIELDPVDVEVDRRAGLEARLALYGVRLADLGRRVIDDEAVTRFPGVRDVGEMLERQSLPGVQVHRQDKSWEPNFGDLCVSLQRGRTAAGNERCSLIVLDGVILGASGAALVPPEMVSAVVVLLPTEATLVFGTRGGAGAVLLFSR